MSETVNWRNPQQFPTQQFRCWSCGNLVASDRGIEGIYEGVEHAAFVALCPNCTHPTFLRRGVNQVPAPRSGNDVAGIDEKSVRDLYNEARDCTAARAYTASVLCCRKILMHVAVAKGAPVGDSFVAYVDYLAAKGYVPPDGREWVDHIRTSGNDANHQIIIADRDSADELLGFAEMLLKFVYEFPQRVRARRKPPGTP